MPRAFCVYVKKPASSCRSFPFASSWNRSPSQVKLWLCSFPLLSLTTVGDDSLRGRYLDYRQLPGSLLCTEPPYVREGLGDKADDNETLCVCLQVASWRNAGLGTTVDHASTRREQCHARRDGRDTQGRCRRGPLPYWRMSLPLLPSSCSGCGKSQQAVISQIFVTLQAGAHEGEESEHTHLDGCLPAAPRAFQRSSPIWFSPPSVQDDPEHSVHNVIIDAQRNLPTLPPFLLATSPGPTHFLCLF